MAYIAKLIVGETYHVQGINFVKDKAVEVDEALAEYLSNNKQFIVFKNDSEQSHDENELSREELLAKAEELELDFDKRISTKKLAKLVEDAQKEGDE